MLAISAGLVMLCLLPGLRIVLAPGIYLRRRSHVDVMVAAFVLLELPLSMIGIAGQFFPTTDLRLPTTDLRLPTPDHRPPTSDHRPPTTRRAQPAYLHHLAYTGLRSEV
jgi:hypothetical protein